MPYASISELPPQVKRGLTAHQQQVFLNVFNSMSKEGKTEGVCFAGAWAAARRASKKSMFMQGLNPKDPQELSS